MSFSGTYAVEAEDLSYEARTLLKDMDNSIIAHLEIECEAKLKLMRRVR